MSATNSLIEQLIGSSGQVLGLKLNGFTFVPFSQGGLIMQDASGVNWLLTIGTDGRLSTQQVTL